MKLRIMRNLATKATGVVANSVAIFKPPFFKAAKLWLQWLLQFTPLFTCACMRAYIRNKNDVVCSQRERERVLDYTTTGYTLATIGYKGVRLP